MTWDCEAFDHWLDGARSDTGPAAAHAAACSRCAGALSAARAVDEALALPAAGAAPGGFTDAVMRRVRAAQALSRPPRPVEWRRVVGDPVVVAAAAIFASAALAWRLQALGGVAADLSTRLAAWSGAALSLPAVLATVPTWGAWRALSAPIAQLGLGIALSPAVLWASWRIFRRLEQQGSVSLRRALRVG